MARNHQEIRNHGRRISWHSCTICHAMDNSDEFLRVSRARGFRKHLEWWNSDMFVVQQKLLTKSIAQKMAAINCPWNNLFNEWFWRKFGWIVANYGTAKILRFSREWLALFWLVWDTRIPQQKQIERCPVAFLRAWLQQIQSRREQEGLHRKLDSPFWAFHHNMGLLQKFFAPSRLNTSTITTRRSAILWDSFRFPRLLAELQWAKCILHSVIEVGLILYLSSTLFCH